MRSHGKARRQGRTFTTVIIAAASVLTLGLATPATTQAAPNAQDRTPLTAEQVDGIVQYLAHPRQLPARPKPADAPQPSHVDQPGHTQTDRASIRLASAAPRTQVTPADHAAAPTPASPDSSDNTGGDSLAVVLVPEPASIVLALVGSLLILRPRRR